MVKSVHYITYDMISSEGDVKIVETEKVELKYPISLDGLPDVGLVGAIAAVHLVETLNLKEIGYVESKLFPPVMVLHEGILKEPLRIYANESLIVIVSEIVIPPVAIYSLSQSLANWIKDKGVKLHISMNGFPDQQRLNVEKPEVFGIGNRKEAIDILNDNKVNRMEMGFVAGLYPQILKELAKRDVSAIALLSQAYLKYPDPGASASVLEVLSKIVKIDIDTKPLIEKAGEIKVRLRDLMKHTQNVMSGIGKGAEHEIPLMYR